jgi:peptidoglycan/LPS O-acetylase OafA/YrhL
VPDGFVMWTDLRRSALTWFNVETWSALALARFVLASIVVVNHLAGYAKLTALALVPRFGSFEAILGFLVISGFSIGSSYRKEPDGFLARRALRIWPIYLVAMVLTFIADPQPPTGRFGLELLENALFLNQITTPGSYVGPAWSLSLEVWLYCLTPWLVRQRPALTRHLMWGSFAAFCAYELCRSAFHLPYYAGLGFGLNLPLLAFCWLCGLSMTSTQAEAIASLRCLAWIFTSYLLLTVSIEGIHLWRQNELSRLLAEAGAIYCCRGVTLLSIWLLFRRVIYRRSGGRRSTAWRLLGDISYPMYLTHVPAFALLSLALPADQYLLLLGAMLVAAAIYYLVDIYSRRRHVMSAARAQAS